MSDVQYACTVVVAIVLLSTPPIATGLEATMATHMLVQIPAFVALGILLARMVPAAVMKAVGRYNAHGLVGLMLAMCVSAVWMVPRAIDAATIDASASVAKTVSLVGTGIAVRLSWSAAGTIVQLFFVGNWTWMTAAVGLFYVESPLRLCNAYLINDQYATGGGLLVLSLSVFILWAVGQGGEIQVPDRREDLSGS